jgi:hypothetical protein
MLTRSAYGTVTCGCACGLLTGMPPSHRCPSCGGLTRRQMSTSPNYGFVIYGHASGVLTGMPPSHRTPQLRRLDAVVISQPLLPCPLETFGLHQAAPRSERPRTALPGRPGSFAEGAGQSPPFANALADPSAAASEEAAAVAGAMPGQQAARRPVVFISGRVHPGETPASYVTQVGT